MNQIFTRSRMRIVVFNTILECVNEVKFLLNICIYPKCNYYCIYINNSKITFDFGFVNASFYRI